MGNLFSKQVDSLHETLLNPIEEVVLCSGDLLLVCSSELELCLVSEIWAHVAVVVGNQTSGHSFAYHSGVFEDLQHYISRHRQVETRRLEVWLPTTFDSDLYRAAQTSADQLLMETDLTEEDREGYAVADVLQKVGLVSVRSLCGIRPVDFSAQAQLIEHYGEQRPLGEQGGYVHHMSKTWYQ